MLCRVLRLKTNRPQKYPYACHTTSCLRHCYYINGTDNTSIELSAAKAIRMSVTMMRVIMLERMLCLLIPI